MPPSLFIYFASHAAASVYQCVWAMVFPLLCARQVLAFQGVDRLARVLYERMANFHAERKFNTVLSQARDVLHSHIGNAYSAVGGVAASFDAKLWSMRLSVDSMRSSVSRMFTITSSEATLAPSFTATAGCTE